jgi:hypothetical protein
MFKVGKKDKKSFNAPWKNALLSYVDGPLADEAVKRTPEWIIINDW